MRKIKEVGVDFEVSSSITF